MTAHSTPIAFLASLAAFAPLSLAQGSGAPLFDSSVWTVDFNETFDGVDTGDLDGDGDPDVVCCSVTKIGVNIMTNDGSGRYSKSFVIPTFGLKVSLADLDLDGRLDVVATGTQSLSIVMATQPGQYRILSKLPTPDLPTQTIVGDVNHDGVPDLVSPVKTLPSASILVHLGLGGGAFSPPITILTSPALGGLDIADTDGDGHLDLVGTIGTQNTLQIFRGDGLGGFLAAASIPVPNPPVDVRSADLDYDGDVDLVAVCGNGKPVAVYKNLGGGTFGSPTLFAAGLTTLAGQSVLTDIDGDALYDLYVTPNDTSFSTMCVLRGNGPASFAPPHFLETGHVAKSGRVADVNRDGKLDLLYGTRHGICVFLQNDASSWGPPSKPVNGEASCIATGDFNRDGLPDLVATEYTTTALSLFEGLDGAHFSDATVIPVSPHASTVVVADWNLDGESDLGVATDNTIDVLLGNGTGSFAHNGTAPAGPQAWHLAVGDVNLDGRLDLVTANLAAKTNTVLLGDGAGGWSGISTHSVPGFPWGVALADLDENGALDIATGIYTNPQGVHVRFGSATGFTGTQFVAFGNSLFEAYATAADVNGDDHADLLFAYNEFASPNNLQYLQVRLGYGTGGFGPILTSKVAGQFTNHMAVGDLTLDGLADVLVCNSNLIGGNVALLAGLGDGTFESVVSAVAGRLPEHVAISDLDGDGLPDFVTAVGGSNRVTIHRDLSKPPAGTRVFGTGTPGCQGTLSMSSNTAPRIGTPGFGLTVDNAPSKALLSVWITNAADFAGTDLFGLGVLLHVDPVLATRQLELTTLSDSSGLAFAPISIPNLPPLVNARFFAQALALWPSGSCSPTATGLSSSRGLEIAILP